MALDRWSLIHGYQHKVANDEASPLLCPDCNDPLFVAAGTDGQPVLKCFYCRSVMSPGLHIWDQIKKALDV